MWQSKVYKKKDRTKMKNWEFTKSNVMKRDKYACQRCDTNHKRSKRKLGVHHILPRLEGGGDNYDNLITLCHECHDLVEIEGYRSKTEIIGSYDLPIGANEDGKTMEQIDDGRPSWHAKVYGGQRS